MWSAGLNQLRGAKAAERTRKEAELRMIESRLRRIVDAIADGVTALTLRDELLALETRKVALEPELAGWREEPVRLHSEYGRRYHKQVEELAALVQSEEDKQDAFEAIRGLVDRIVLSPERGKLRVDLHGEIAAILRLAQAGKKPRPRPRGQG
jgi:plasmid stabilization system protein ParE